MTGLSMAKTGALGCVSVLALTFGSTGAWAQAATGAAAAQEAGAHATIVVTARKHEESLLDVPVAISAFSGADLADIGARDMSDFIELSPGVSFVQGGDFARLSIRGISTSLGGNANGYYLDNIPFTGVTVPWNPNVAPFDIDRVEVLRGPQGTLFGEGSMGGTVRIITKAPELDRFAVGTDGFLSSTRGGGENFGVRGMINIPILEDRIAIRLVGVQEEYDGWIDVIGGEKNHNSNNLTTWRARLMVKPVDELTLEAAYWSSDQRLKGSSMAFDNGTVAAPLPSGVGYDQYSFGASYDFGGATLSYSYGNNDLYYGQTAPFPLPSPPFPPGTVSSLVQTSDIGVETHELLLVSGSDRFNWTVGGYYRKADRDDYLELVGSGIAGTAVAESSAWAAFGELEYRFSDRFRLAAGIRYFDEKRTQSEFGVGLLGPINDSLTEHYDSVNPRVIATFEPNRDHLFYASAAKGFRGGQIQPRTSQQFAAGFGIPLPSSVPSDSIWTYEFGAKNQFLDGALRFESAVYYSRWKNPPVRFELAPNFNGIVTADGTKTWGFETAAFWTPVTGLTLSGGLSLIDAEFTEAVPGTPIRKGDTPPDLSRTSWNLAAQYKAPAFGDFDLFARASVLYNSRRSNTAFLSNLPGDAITQVDARVGVQNDLIGLFLFADNLFDENGAIAFRSIQGAMRLRPRTIGLELRLSH